jgi:hypothetical protein
LDSTLALVLSLQWRGNLLPYKPASIGGKRTNMAKFYKNLKAIKDIFAVASKKRMP